MKPVLYWVLFLFPLLNNAQSSKDLMPLSVGDKVPYLKFKNVLNAPYTTTNLVPQKGKLLLLDFWFIHCGSCIAEFPKMDSLQSQFKDQVELLFATVDESDTEIALRDFFNKKKSPSGAKYSFPVTREVGQLNKLFPHLSNPHTVWIYNGKVIAITSALEVNAHNIQAMLKDPNYYLPRKEDQMDFDFKVPLLQGGNGANYSSLISRSTFVRYIKGISGTSASNTIENGRARRWVFTNQPILGLYRYAYPSLPPNRVFLEDNLNSSLILPKTLDSALKVNNMFNYELIMPGNPSSEVRNKKMRQDLDIQFGLKSRIDTRSVPCFALIKLKDSIGGYYLNTKKVPEGFSRNEEGIYSLSELGFSSLIYELNAQVTGRNLNPIVIDETNYTGKVDMELNVKNIRDIDSLKTVLKPYGFDIIPVVRELELLVISKSKIQ